MSPPPSRAAARYVLGVMFLLTALDVMDRQLLAALAEPVKAEFGLSDSMMGVLLGSAFGLASAVRHLFATRIGVAMGETVGSGPAQSLLADYFPAERRAAALSVHASGGTLGAMLGAALGDAIGQAFGWRWAFVLRATRRLSELP